ncbi:unnamed protein product [Laminaria digitata]
MLVLEYPGIPGTNILRTILFVVYRYVRTAYIHTPRPFKGDERSASREEDDTFIPGYQASYIPGTRTYEVDLQLFDQSWQALFVSSFGDVQVFFFPIVAGAS